MRRSPPHASSSAMETEGLRSVRVKIGGLRHAQCPDGYSTARLHVRPQRGRRWSPELRKRSLARLHHKPVRAECDKKPGVVRGAAYIVWRWGCNTERVCGATIPNGASVHTRGDRTGPLFTHVKIDGASRAKRNSAVLREQHHAAQQITSQTRKMNQKVSAQAVTPRRHRVCASSM